MHAIGGDYGSSVVPAFLHKLWALIEDENTNDLIAWDPVSFDCIFFARVIS